MNLPKSAFLLCSLIVTLLFTGCAERKMNKVADYAASNNPPNCIEISENFFADQTEISNFHWLEYLYWNSRVYGKSSAEYRATLPDSAIWAKADTCLATLDTFYLRHPPYRDYPVVGVSQAQAEAYAQWRADRVFEYILIKHKIINSDTAQKGENHFSIERFYAGKVERNDNGVLIDFYPEFRLPTLAERQQIQAFADSVDNAFLAQNTKAKASCSDIETNIRCGIKPCDPNTENPDATVDIFSYCSKVRPQNGIYHLRGNVSEWLAEKDQSTGGNWSNTLEEVLLDHIVIDSATNAFTGFRCVGTWKTHTP